MQDKEIIIKVGIKEILEIIEGLNLAIDSGADIILSNVDEKIILLHAVTVMADNLQELQKEMKASNNQKGIDN